MSSEEPVVDLSSSLPHGYTFIRSGNVYITKNCRKLTQQAGRTVYVVRDSRRRTCGIRVPTRVWKTVQKLNAETRDQRSEAVQKKDTALEDKARVELLKQFPRIPKDRVQQILRHMLRKRSCRVGRSKDMETRQMVALGVTAHIRHRCTDYDRRMAQGIVKEEARRRVKDDIENVVKEWTAVALTATKSVKEGRSAVSKRSVVKWKDVIPRRRSSLRLRAKRESGNKSTNNFGEPMDIDIVAQASKQM